MDGVVVADADQMLCWCPAGNDLSRSFRWGAEFEHGWIKGHASVYSTLKKVSRTFMCTASRCHCLACCTRGKV